MPQQNEPKFSPGEWTMKVNESWPFNISIIAGDKEILNVSRWALSSRHKTIADLESARGFPKDERENVIQMLEEQKANMRLWTEAKSMFELLKSMTALVVIKYGNLHDDVNKEVEKAQELIKRVQG